MPIQQQEPALVVVHDRAGRVSGRPYDVMLESSSAGDLDVGQRERHPLALVDRPLAVDDPLHGLNATGITAPHFPQYARRTISSSTGTAVRRIVSATGAPHPGHAG